MEPGGVSGRFPVFSMAYDLHFYEASGKELAPARGKARRAGFRRAREEVNNFYRNSIDNFQILPNSQNSLRAEGEKHSGGLS